MHGSPFRENRILSLQIFLPECLRQRERFLPGKIQLVHIFRLIRQSRLRKHLGDREAVRRRVDLRNHLHKIRLQVHSPALIEDDIFDTVF